LRRVWGGREREGAGKEEFDFVGGEGRGAVGG
jgi:hypothetical protein